MPVEPLRGSRTHPRSALAALALLCLVASACGSTAQQGGEPAAGSMGGSGALSPQASSPAGGGITAPPVAEIPRDADASLEAANGPVGGGQRPGLDDRRPDDLVRDRGAGGTSSGPAGGTTRGEGPGFTAEQIRIGIPMSRDPGEANQAVGAQGVDPGDPRHQLQIIVDHMNATGGIAGREVVPVVYEIDENSSQTWEQQYQAACTHWTEDERVFAVVLLGNFWLRDSLRSCLQERGVPLWHGAITSNTDASSFSRFPFYLETASIHLGRLSRTLPDALAEQDYFRSQEPIGDVRLGLLRYDQPAYERAANEHLKPALARHGIEVAEEAVVSEPQRLSDVGAMSPQIGSAVLRFRTADITHVVSLEPSALMVALFMIQAEGQSYRPRYGLHTGNGPAILVHNVPVEQLHGAVGMGHAPLADVEPDRWPSEPGRERCIRLMEDAGTELSEINARLNAAHLCDGFGLLQASAREITEPLAPEKLLAGLAGIGGAFETAATPRAAYSSQKRDGAAAYRHLAFGEDCSCFAYTSDLRATR